jgi:hypothetical protein
MMYEPLLSAPEQLNPGVRFEARKGFEPQNEAGQYFNSPESLLEALLAPGVL